VSFRRATIGSVGWATPLIAVVAALIAFVGGFFGARWQARNNLAQWRRDKLLEFCAGLLAAGAELDDLGRASGGGEDLPYPKEAFNQTRLARSRVLLLSEELGFIAFDYTKMAMAFVLKGRQRPLDLDGFTESAQKLGQSQGRFLRAAHDHLRDRPKPRTPWRERWRHVWLRVSRRWRNTDGEAATTTRRFDEPVEETAYRKRQGNGAPWDPPPAP
jgi:hypothetical protein